MGNNTLITILPLILLLVVMYFLLIRPQRKREKEVNTMRSNIRVGDEIITIGGICAKVVKTKEDSLVIQVGADKLKFEVMRWAVSKVVNADSRPEPEPEPEEEEEKKPAKPKRLVKKAAKEEAPEPAPEVVEEAVEEAEEVVEEVVEDVTE